MYFRNKLGRLERHTKLAAGTEISIYEHQRSHAARLLQELNIKQNATCIGNSMKI